MNSNKITSLSLTESLKDFQRAIAPLLELGKVEQWDGKTLKKREEKIKDSALVLAGKCIAILLYQLSKWDEALIRAVAQTQGWWRKKTRKNGTKDWTILTVGNVKVTLKCQAALSQRRSQIFHLERGTLPSTNILKGKRVVISVDGGRSRLIDKRMGDT
jgi:predicted transcriptional regulator